MRSRSGNIDMTEGKPLKLILAFSLPLMFGNIFQQFYTVTDTAIVGRGVGITALAALGAVDWLAWLPFCVPQGFSQGFSVLAAQKYGEKDWAGLKKTVGLSFRLSLILAAACTALFIPAIPFLLNILSVKEELQGMASLYLYFIFGSFVVATLYNTTASLLRAAGDSRTPLLAMIISSVTNIILDVVAVFFLKLGIGGAAAATVASQIVACTVCYVKLQKNLRLHFTAADMRRDPVVMKHLIRLGLPMCLMNFIICVGGLMVVKVVNSFSIGFIAGYTAANKLFGILDIASMSYGYAVTTYVGQNYGAKNSDRILKGVRTALLLSIVTSVIIGGSVILLGRPLTGLFLSADDPVIYAAARETSFLFLLTICLGLPLLYVLYVYRSALQGMGETTVPFLSSFIEFAIRVGVALLVQQIRYENGIFFAEVGAWIGAAAFLGVMYYILRGKIFRKMLSDPPSEANA